MARQRILGTTVAGVVALLLCSGASCGEPDRSGATSTSTSTSTTTTTTTTTTTARPADTIPPDTAAPGAAAPGAIGGWQEDLAGLQIAEPSSRDGYDRALFPHWIDADANRCDTRCEVLLREFRQDLPDAPNGGWFSVYDGVVTAESSELDVDHTVALSEAWVSGADRWDEARRRAFANDLHPGALRAVTASVNRSKGDRDPAEWQPPRRESWCGYAADWVRTKVRWQLSADREEFTALVTMLEGCP